MQRIGLGLWEMPKDEAREVPRGHVVGLTARFGRGAQPLSALQREVMEGLVQSSDHPKPEPFRSSDPEG